MTPRQRRFVFEYLIDANGAQAAVRAGYARRWAALRALRLVQTPQVRALIDAERAARAARTGLSPERVFDEFVRIAFAEISRIVAWDEGGATLKDWRALAPGDAAAIAALAVDGAGRVSVRLHDKGAALAALARRLGLIEVRRRTPVEALAAAAQARALIARRLAAPGAGA
jgi:phage terminase small subunit